MPAKRGVDSRDPKSKNWYAILRRNQRYSDFKRVREFNQLRDRLGIPKGASAQNYVPSENELQKLREQLVRQSGKRQGGEGGGNPESNKGTRRAEPVDEADNMPNDPTDEAMKDLDLSQVPGRHDDQVPMDEAIPSASGLTQRKQGNPMATAGYDGSNIGVGLRGVQPGWQRQTRTVRHRKRVYFMGEPRNVSSWKAAPDDTNDQRNYYLDTKMHKLPDKDLQFYVSPQELVEQNPAATAWSLDSCGWKLAQFEFFENVENAVAALPEELPTLSHDVEVIEDPDGHITYTGAYKLITEGIYPDELTGLLGDEVGVSKDLDMQADTLENEVDAAGNDRLVGIPGWVAQVPTRSAIAAGTVSRLQAPDLLRMSHIGPIEELMGHFSRRYNVNSGKIALNMTDGLDTDKYIEKISIDALAMGTSPLHTAPGEARWYTDRAPIKSRFGEVLFRARPQNRIRTNTYKPILVKCILDTECTFSTYIRDGYIASFARGDLPTPESTIDDLWRPTTQIAPDAITRRLMVRTDNKTHLRTPQTSANSLLKTSVYPPTGLDSWTKSVPAENTRAKAREAREKEKRALHRKEVKERTLESTRQ